MSGNTFSIKENIYLISALIYVVAMFPLYYLYEAYPAQRYQLIPDLTWISIGGAFLLFLQLFVAAWYARGPTVSETQKTSGTATP